MHDAIYAREDLDFEAKQIEIQKVRGAVPGSCARRIQDLEGASQKGALI